MKKQKSTVEEAVQTWKDLYNFRTSNDTQHFDADFAAMLARNPDQSYADIANENVSLMCLIASEHIALNKIPDYVPSSSEYLDVAKQRMDRQLQQTERKDKNMSGIVKSMSIAFGYDENGQSVVDMKAAGIVQNSNRVGGSLKTINHDVNMTRRDSSDKVCPMLNALNKQRFLPDTNIQILVTQDALKESFKDDARYTPDSNGFVNMTGENMSLSDFESLSNPFDALGIEAMEPHTSIFKNFRQAVENMQGIDYTRNKQCLVSKDIPRRELDKLPAVHTKCPAESNQLVHQLSVDGYTWTNGDALMTSGRVSAQYGVYHTNTAYVVDSAMKEVGLCHSDCAETDGFDLLEYSQLDDAPEKEHEYPSMLDGLTDEEFEKMLLSTNDGIGDTEKL